MSDTATTFSPSTGPGPMTRRAFMETSVVLAGGAALTVMPVLSGVQTFAPPSASEAPWDAPAVTFDAYFTGWPVYDFSGRAEPYEPPVARQPGAALAAMSDEEFHRHFMYL